MSPKTLKALSKSPAASGRRSSSGGSGNLRPVIPFGLDDGSALDEDLEDIGGPELGPMPTGRTQPFAAGEGGKGVDEVEASLVDSRPFGLLMIGPNILCSICTANDDDLITIMYVVMILLDLLSDVEAPL